MTSWHCDSLCKVSSGGAGPWTDDDLTFFVKIKAAHNNCIGFQSGEPKIGNLTEIEQVFTDYFNQNIHEWFHNLNFYLKGPNKVCLIKDRWKIVNQV